MPSDTTKAGTSAFALCPPPHDLLFASDPLFRIFTSKKSTMKSRHLAGKTDSGYFSGSKDYSAYWARMRCFLESIKMRRL
jgi:hypothetical protein